MNKTVESITDFSAREVTAVGKADVAKVSLEQASREAIAREMAKDNQCRQADARNTTRTKRQTDVFNLHQRFELFGHRCAFIMVALEKMAFEQEPEDSTPVSMGASFYVGDLMEEMVDLRLMMEELYQGEL